VLTLGTFALSIAEGQDRPADKTPSLGKEIVQAWQKAGAKLGWAGIDEGGALRWHEQPRPGDLPIFRCSDVKVTSFQTLPRPSVPFGIQIYSWRADDEVLKAVAQFDHLQYFDLDYLPLPDQSDLRATAPRRDHPPPPPNAKETFMAEGLKHLARLKDVRYLGLSYAGLKTDAALKDFAKWKNLRALDLSDTGVTDAGLAELSGLTRLTLLNLSRTKVTDRGLKHFAGCRELWRLDLGGTSITDASLETIGKFSNLRELIL
jgi:hypothetical protein